MPESTPQSPFKLKMGRDPLEVAKEILGEPFEVMVSTMDPWTRMRWVFREGEATVSLEVSHAAGAETMDMTVTHEFPEERVAPAQRIYEESFGRLKRFVSVVRKPWDQWTEDEVMEDPMWICLYKEQNGPPTPAMHAMMAMESYARPNNKWVRRYFDNLTR